MSITRRHAIQLLASAVPAAAATPALSFSSQAASAEAAGQGFAPRQFTFSGIFSELRIPLKDLGVTAPADLSGYTHLVMDLRTSSPQRMSLWAYTAQGPRSMGFIAFGQHAWLRASVPLHFFQGRDSKGFDLASAGNRRTNSCWFSVWGPFGDTLSSGVVLAFNGLRTQLAHYRVAQRSPVENGRGQRLSRTRPAC